LRLIAASILFCSIVACAKETPPPAEDQIAVAADIVQRRAQFAPTQLSAQLQPLSAGDRAALMPILHAAAAMDRIFARQAFAGQASFSEDVARLSGPSAQAAQDYYRIMVGPWDRITDEPFLGTARKPAGAGFYPADMSKEEFEAWIAAHPEQADAFRSLTTMIMREGSELRAIPYSEFFHGDLTEAAAELRKAAGLASTPSLQKFLRSRADAFLNDDYYQSDMDWMDLDGPLELVIGPYETYEDGLFGYKAAFEAFVCIADPEDSAQLEGFKHELPWLEQQLPIDDVHKNPNRGTDSPIRVTDIIMSSGDTRSGIQTIAFNLPNDERVREAKGSKKVLLKNVMQAKYDNILTPIAAVSLPASDAAKSTWDAYFYFTLFHELCHGLGPGKITLNGRETEVRLELKELYSAIEEAKADVMGTWALYMLADKGVVAKPIADAMAWTFVPGLLRSARFGVTEAHGLGVVCQFSYLIEKGAIEVTPDQRLRPVLAKWRGAITDLCHDLTMLQANGDYEGTKAFVAKYGAVPPAMQSILDSLGSIPVDIDPVYESVRS
jgi:Peptidase family M49